VHQDDGNFAGPLELVIEPNPFTFAIAMFALSLGTGRFAHGSKEAREIIRITSDSVIFEYHARPKLQGTGSGLTVTMGTALCGLVIQIAVRRFCCGHCPLTVSCLLQFCAALSGWCASGQSRGFSLAKRPQRHRALAELLATRATKDCTPASIPKSIPASKIRAVSVLVRRRALHIEPHQLDELVPCVHIGPFLPTIAQTFCERDALPTELYPLRFLPTTHP
jgi:hypothetical protein